jgi:hypothetical protein
LMATERLTLVMTYVMNTKDDERNQHARRWWDNKPA